MNASKTCEQREIQLPDSRDAASRPKPTSGDVVGGATQSPYFKPTEVGCVLAPCDPRIGQLSPEAYAALLEER
jgi:hypothetical protein